MSKHATFGEDLKNESESAAVVPSQRGLIEVLASLQQTLDTLPHRIAGEIAVGGLGGVGGPGSFGSKASSRADMYKDPGAVKPKVPVGLSFQVSNIYELDASRSRFSVDLLVNLTWVDPGLQEAVQNGSLRKELGTDIWEGLVPGWQFRDFTSPELLESAVMNDVMELKPSLELMNNLEVEITGEPVALQNLQEGRVGYTVRYQGSFDEFYELQAFPFDVQVGAGPTIYTYT
jgi:hypothetical protein